MSPIFAWVAGRASDVWCLQFSGGDKHGYSLCTGPTLVSKVVYVQIIWFVGAGCWGTPVSTGHARTDKNNLLLSQILLNRLSKQYRAKTGVTGTQEIEKNSASCTRADISPSNT